MRCFTVKWNDKDGEAKISYADWFKPETDSHTQLIILDALSDAIHELTEFYNTTYDTRPIKEKA